MAHRHDSTDEEVQDIRDLIERCAMRHGETGPRSAGYILAFEYVDDEGTHLWALRYDPDMGYASHLGLAKLIDLDADRTAQETLGIIGDDEP